MLRRLLGDTERKEDAVAAFSIRETMVLLEHAEALAADEFRGMTGLVGSVVADVTKLFTEEHVFVPRDLVEVAPEDAGQGGSSSVPAPALAGIVRVAPGGASVVVRRKAAGQAAAAGQRENAVGDDGEEERGTESVGVARVKLRRVSRVWDVEWCALALVRWRDAARWWHLLGRDSAADDDLSIIMSCNETCS